MRSITIALVVLGAALTGCEDKKEVKTAQPKPKPLGAMRPVASAEPQPAKGEPAVRPLTALAPGPAPRQPAPRVATKPAAVAPLRRTGTRTLPKARTAAVKRPALPVRIKAQPAKPAPRTYTIRRGDTLWSLARTHLADPKRWPEIVAANRDLNLAPERLPIGQVIVLPPR